MDQARNFMGLWLPVTPEDLSRRYRELAKHCHPDLKPGNPEAKKMKALTGAAEVLTGTEATNLPR